MYVCMYVSAQTWLAQKTALSRLNFDSFEFSFLVVSPFALFRIFREYQKSPYIAQLLIYLLLLLLIFSYMYTYKVTKIVLFIL